VNIARNPCPLPNRGRRPASPSVGSRRRRVAPLIAARLPVPVGRWWLPTSTVQGSGGGWSAGPGGQKSPPSLASRHSSVMSLQRASGDPLPSQKPEKARPASSSDPRLAGPGCCLSVSAAGSSRRRWPPTTSRDSAPGRPGIAMRPWGTWVFECFYPARGRCTGWSRSGAEGGQGDSDRCARPGLGTEERAP
jgi:hypothetical protein